MKRTLLSLCALLSAGGLFAQDNSPTSLPAEAATRLREGWKKIQGAPSLPSPSVGVAVFVSANGNEAVLGSPAEQVILDTLRAELARQGFTVVSSELVAKGIATARSALERRGEDESAARAATLLAESTKADVMLVVELMLNADKTAIREFRAYDVRQSPVRLISSRSYKALPLQPPTDRMAQALWFQEQRQGATAMLQRLAEDIAAGPAYVPTYRLQVLGLNRRDYELWVRTLRQDARPGFELVRTPAEFGTSKADVTPLWIRYPGDWLDVKDMLGRTAEIALGRTLVTVFDSGAQDFIVSLQETKEPAFFRFAAADAAPPAEKVGPLLSPQRKPTVTLLFGTDLDAPQAALLDETLALPATTLDGEMVSRTLARYFQAAGFEVKDAAAIRRQLDDEIARANLGRNLAGMRNALRLSNATDYLVLARTDAAGRTLALTILNHTGTQVAFTSFPDLRHKLYEDFVDIRDPASLMRYLGGILLGQLQQQIDDLSPHTIEVVLKNTRNAQQVLTLAGSFRGIGGVLSVTDLKIDQPVASFLVNTTGDITSLLNEATGLAARKEFGAKGIVEVANAQQLVINLAPEWMSAYDTPAVEKKVQELQQPDTPKPANIVDAMRAARESIWIVGFVGGNGVFVGQGTAWTVRPQLLATNAHVYAGLVKKAAQLRKENIPVQVVARNGANLEHQIVIDLEHGRAHPAWEAFARKYKGQDFVLPYDVAILPTTSDAGKPLKLADKADLAALQPLTTIGYSGYPQEDRSGAGLSQQSLLGTINTMTSVFLQDTDDPARRKIVHYSMPSRGGASGSPVFGPAGTVIALHSAGDSISVDQSFEDEQGKLHTVQPRINLGFAYGQRVDMLEDLLNGPTSVEVLLNEWERDYAAAKGSSGR